MPIFLSENILLYGFKKSNITLIKSIEATKLIQILNMNLFVKIFDKKVYHILYFRQQDGI